MNTNSRIYSRMEFNNFKALFILILFTVLFIKTSVLSAQSTSPKFYKGLTASIGTRAFQISSNIPEINNMNVLQEGANAGFIFGNDILKTRITIAGFYYSAARVPRTVNVFEVEGLVNYYPLNSFTNQDHKFSPYILGGIAQDFVKFYGQYLQREEGAPFNNSISQEPLIGKILQTQATLGVGIEYQITNGTSFVTLFAEGRYGLPIVYRPDHVFANTSIKNYSALAIGVSFGLLR